MCVCVCVCCHPIYSGRQTLVDASTGVTQEEGHTGFVYPPSFILRYLPFSFYREKDSAVLFSLRPEVELCVPTN